MFTHYSIYRQYPTLYRALHDAPIGTPLRLSPLNEAFWDNATMNALLAAEALWLICTVYELIRCRGRRMGVLAMSMAGMLLICFGFIGYICDQETANP